MTAVDNVNISLEPGKLTGLIGPNGAGKTTFVDAITGFAPSRGTVMLDDREISRLSATDRARAGLARTWQSTQLFDDLTVAENLAVASATTPWWKVIWSAVAGHRVDSETLGALLDEFEIASSADKLPSALSPGQRKLVGIARALVMQPTVVCFDEPAAGLNTAESEALGVILRRIADNGTTTLLIDHDMGLVLSVCDEVVVLDQGQVIFSGPPDAVQRDARVIEAYLGTTSVPTTATKGSGS